jgi:glycosyltransferase involved in cell wall biosynthesis
MSKLSKECPDLPPLLSIIIPTRNSERYLQTCLHSVHTQRFQDYEILIIDGQSTDSSCQIAESFANCRIISQHGSGLAAAWNQGIKASRGQYISFLDSDDWFAPDALSKHINALASNVGAAYSIGQVRYVADDSNHLPYGFKASLLEGLHDALMPGCFMGKRQLFKDIGLFDESLSVACDIQWFHDLKVHNVRHVRLGTQVLNKRLHQHNLSYTTAETSTYNSELLQVIRRRIHSTLKND